MSYNKYQRTQNAKETQRQTEYRLFTEVTKKLIEVHERNIRDAVMMDALDWNRRLWSTLATDCSVKGNGLNNELRSGIISLSLWVSKHTSLVMRGNESVQDLININKTIMAGLAQQQTVATSQQAPSSTQQKSTSPSQAGNPTITYSGPLTI